MKRQTYLTTHNLTFLYNKNTSMTLKKNTLEKYLQHTHSVKKYCLKMLYSIVAAGCKAEKNKEYPLVHDLTLQ